MNNRFISLMANNYTFKSAALLSWVSWGENLEVNNLYIEVMQEYISFSAEV